MRHDPAFYLTSEWRRFRFAVLRRQPVCQVPGCASPSKHVDHTRSRMAGGMALDDRNVTAMCASCHSRKTAARDGGFGNRPGSGSIGKPGCDAAGSPVDPGHRWAAPTLPGAPVSPVQPQRRATSHHASRVGVSEVGAVEGAADAPATDSRNRKMKTE